MGKLRTSPMYSAILAAVAFGVAAVSFFGIVLQDDLVGRLIFGGTWCLVGGWWLGQYLHSRKAREPRSGPVPLK